MIQEPVQPVLTPTPPRSRGSSWARVGIVVAICLALAVPVVIAMAASSAPSNDPLPLAAGASTAPVAPDTSAKPGVDRGPGHGFGFGWDFFGGQKGSGPRGGGPGRGPITIRSINGFNLGLGTDDGWTRTIEVLSTTVITKGGQPFALGDLKVGDEIRFTEKKNDDGTYTITSITVPTANAGGEVTAVDATTITVKGRGDTTRVITVNGSTAYKLGSAAGTKADVKVGRTVDAQGTTSGDTFTAITVTVRLSERGGEVTAVDATTITVKGKGDTTQVITVNGSTVYTLGSSAGTKADVKVGVKVDARGTVDGTTFTAMTVKVSLAAVGGEVTEKTADSITVKNRDGTTTVIHVTDKTTYHVLGKDAATLADIGIGDRVVASGVLRTDKSLDAVSVGGGHGPKAAKPAAPVVPSSVPS